MLYKFSVRNFKGFKDWITLDLSDVKNYEFNPQCIKNDIISKGLIYGHNNVGKSNLGLAIFDIIFLLTDSQMKNPFLYEDYTNAGLEDNITEFKFEFKFKDTHICYNYGKSSISKIIYERFHINDKLIINYDKRKDAKTIIDIKGTETLNKDLSKINISVLKYIKTNAVIEDSMANKNFFQLFDFIENMLLFKSLDNRLFLGYQSTSNDILTDIVEKNHVKDFENFLHNAEIDIDLSETEINGKKTINLKLGDKTINYWKNCSTGIRSLTVLYYWLQRINMSEKPPSFIFIDEFDAFYHLSLSKIIVKELLKNNCQIILTSHNTSLMSNDLLRPDCYFLMYKNKIASLPKLTEKELRKAHNIEKMYKAGAFNV